MLIYFSICHFVIDSKLHCNWSMQKIRMHQGDNILDGTVLLLFIQVIFCQGLANFMGLYYIVIMHEYPVKQGISLLSTRLK